VEQNAENTEHAMKPRLMFRDGQWICWTIHAWYTGFGPTPREAYKDWKWANQIMK
jgi:hypothetical protein